MGVFPSDLQVPQVLDVRRDSLHWDSDKIIEDHFELPAPYDILAVSRAL
jgi:hypothetical protein